MLSDREPILSLRRLTKTYDGHAVVDAVTLDIEEGQFLTLLGPSGSGKTSILMMMAGFVEPSAGAILSKGRDITGIAPEKRNFGMVFQGYALFPHLTVAKNVEFPLAVRGWPAAERAAKVRWALELVRLSGLAGRLPNALSGGQQQRVALARALVFSPDLLLLDEPLSALDKQLRGELQTELRQLHKQLGKTFICVTHDQEEALSMSDEIAVLSNGKLLQKGAPRDLYERPASHFVAGFLGESNFIEGRMVAVTDQGIVYGVGDLEMRQAKPSLQFPVGAPLLIAIRPAKISVAVEKPTAEANCLGGTIIDLIYRGENILLGARTAFGTLRAEQRSHSIGNLRIGDTVWLHWQPDSGVIVADDRQRQTTAVRCEGSALGDKS